MKKFLHTICIAFSFVISGHAQTDPLYAQYLNNPLLLNPAYSGFNNNLNASVTYRKQWAGFDGSPETFNATAHTSLHDNKMGAGLIVLQDKIGPSKNTEVHGTYSYKLDLGNKELTFGLQAGLTNFRSDYSDLNVYDPGGDEFSENLNFTKVSFGSGIILSSERYFVGFSVPRLLKTRQRYYDTEVEIYRQHFYLAGASVFFLSDRVRVKPSLLVKGVQGAPLSADIQVLFNIDEKYSAGVLTRNFNTYGMLGQMKLSDKYRIGYAMEVPTNQSVGARFTSHELTLGVNLSVFDFHDTISINTF
jgi:type IX secretion system PorP/SprF family membrane protein